MGIKANLTAYWTLNESAGASRADSVGSNTLTDHATVGQGTGLLDGDATFVAASSQYLSIASNSDVRTGDIDVTFSAWVKLTTKPNAAMFLMGKWGASGTREYALYYTGATVTDRFSFIVSGTGTTGTPGTDFQGVDATTFGSPSTATWYLVQGSHDSVNNRISIAVNAGAANTAAWSGGIHLDTNEFDLGRNSEGAAYLNGQLDECFIAKRVWSPADASLIYNGGAGLRLGDWDSAEWNQPRRNTSVVVPVLPYRVVPPSTFAWMLTGGVIPTPLDWSPVLAQGRVAVASPPVRTLQPGSMAWLFDPQVRPTPPIFKKGKARTKLRRVPQFDTRRLAHTVDVLHEIANSLSDKGQLVKGNDSLTDWQIVGGAHVQNRAPGANDDAQSGFVVGAPWVDSITKALYFCVDNTNFAAVWRGPF